MEENKAAFRLDLAELRRLKDEVGQMPPAPATRRGRTGAMLVGIVRRALFWVWPPLHAFFDVLCRMLDRLSGSVVELDSRLAAFSAEHGTGQRISTELADIRAHRDHMDAAQAELWIEIAKLKAELAAVQSGRMGRSGASLS